MEDIIEYIYNIADDLPEDLVTYQNRLKAIEKHIVDLQSKYNKAQEQLTLKDLDIESIRRSYNIAKELLKKSDNKLNELNKYVIEHPYNVLYRDEVKAILDKEV
jgi:predicted  nucleic acid-binding Zn-ribbon protein